MALVKSHSNYVLKSKHQNTSDGTIYERDITTIGGLNQFSSSMTPIYKSGNFIISVRADSRSSSEYNTTKFETNSNGSTTWTLQSLEDTISNNDDDNETKIVLKQDYYDFCDFAYYGSLSELFRASMRDIISRFPGELYGTSYNIYYSSKYNIEFEEIEERNMLGEDNLVALDNPFNINIHAMQLPSDGKAIKYFADGGYKNYVLIEGSNGVAQPITSWTCDYAVAILPNKEKLDLYLSKDDFYNNVLINVFKKYQKEKFNLLWYNRRLNTDTPVDVRTEYDELVNEFNSGKTHDKLIEYTKGDYKYRIHENGSSTIKDHASTLTEIEKKVEELKAANPTKVYTVVSGVKYSKIDDYLDGSQCIGDNVGRVIINDKTIYIYVGENNNAEYLYEDGTLNDWHIRPSESAITEFYNDCDNFEKLLLNRKSTPKYKAIFSVMKENQYGYYRNLEKFIFPTTYGDYNLDVKSHGYTKYIKRLTDIGEFYDERFCDNLYRSMTHEAIKNFDWSYTREFYQGDEDEYVEGGEKIQKTLRLFAREFDELKAYIDAIKNNNTITYDERSNVPDYFLTDLAENKGWDIRLVYPFEAMYTDGKRELSNVTFSQVFSGTVTPYSSTLYNKDLVKYGFFVTCCEDDVEAVKWDIDCRYSDTDKRTYQFIPAKDDNLGTTYFDSCSNKTRDRVRAYMSDEEYSYKDVSNEFLRRLNLNSNYIWRHKGTVDGVEMVFGMFGLRSKRFVDTLKKTENCIPNDNYDYEIVEYSRFAYPYVDKWEDCHMMHTIDWYNSTKTITYDNRSESNYTLYGANVASDYSTYQGLPITYRWKDENDKTADWYLYPNFDKDDELDGNPYFQMNGGWLQKKLNGTYFQFDRDNHIVTATTPLYKETLLTVKRVDTIADLLAIPEKDLYDNIICYVTNVEKDIAIVNGKVYNINYDINGKKYINLIMQGGGIRVGDDRFFDNDICVYDSDYNEYIYTLTDKTDGYTVKAYIKDNPADDEDEFVCRSVEEGAFYFQSFMVFNPTFGETTEGMSNYFVLKHTSYNTSLAYLIDKDNNTWSEDGWERLKETDERLTQVKANENYFNGNNPHCGNMSYDNGETYYEYFKHLFKYACENELFDERCHDNFYEVIDSLYNSGFTIDNTDTVDSKIHYFGHYYRANNSTRSNNIPTEQAALTGISYYCDLKTEQCKEKWNEFVKQNPNLQVNNYVLSNKDYMLSKQQYPKTDDETVNQVMNNKRMTIKFYLKNTDTSKDAYIEEVKYLDYIVMNYVTQVIPTTTILDIEYKFNRN